MMRAEGTSLPVRASESRLIPGEMPMEALQGIRAAATAADAYLHMVAEFNRSQFRFLRALGRTPGRAP
jgi:hypothetical protein